MTSGASGPIQTITHRTRQGMMDYKASPFTSKSMDFILDVDEFSVSKRCPMKEQCTVNSVVFIFTRNLQSSVDWVIHRVWRYFVLWLFIGPIDLSLLQEIYRGRWLWSPTHEKVAEQGSGTSLLGTEQLVCLTDALLFNSLPGVWNESGSRAGSFFH